MARPDPTTPPSLEDRRRSDAGATHALRLGVDLQVDTLLFTLAAAAVATGEGRDGVDAPWRRWLAEDLDAALELARDVVHRHAALPASLAGGDRGSDRILPDLAARYEALLALIDDAGDDPAPAVVAGLRRVRARYAARLSALALPGPALAGGAVG